ncbi:MAG TPA: hydroxymethylbilane synthase [Candidatus Methylomirabilis sp.]|nr:hydroxymethylbilane synthase [Candidatus Methylomirabilis sp.]
MKLRLGTRGSRLALIQTQSVADALIALGVDVDVTIIRTSGDHLAQVALADFGGKALFVKEIEEALLEGRADVGVHSLKDVPGVLPAGLCLAAFPRRADPRDCLVTRQAGGLGALPPGAVVGSSSPRRRVLLLSERPDLRVEPIRGNVETRLAKLASGAYDALVLAKAGLDRLGLVPAHASTLPVAQFVPAVGQGILGVEVRQDDREAQRLVAQLDDRATRIEAQAERAFLLRLGAGCHTAVAGHARLAGDEMTLTGVVASPDGATVLRSSVGGLAASSEALGQKLADELLERGARRLLESAETPP